MTENSRTGARVLVGQSRCTATEARQLDSSTAAWLPLLLCYLHDLLFQHPFKTVQVLKLPTWLTALLHVPCQSPAALPACSLPLTASGLSLATCALDPFCAIPAPLHAALRNAHIITACGPSSLPLSSPSHSPSSPPAGSSPEVSACRGRVCSVQCLSLQSASSASRHQTALSTTGHPAVAVHSTAHTACPHQQTGLSPLPAPRASGGWGRAPFGGRGKGKEGRRQGGSAG